MVREVACLGMARQLGYHEMASGVELDLVEGAVAEEGEAVLQAHEVEKRNITHRLPFR